MGLSGGCAYRCKKVKPHSDFGPHATSNDGLTSWCNECKATYTWTRNVGMTEQEFLSLLESQSHKCAICGDDSRELVVDHDHADSFIRGLLCARCNTGLGQFKDNINNLLAAIAYLGKPKTPYIYKGKSGGRRSKRNAKGGDQNNGTQGKPPQNIPIPQPPVKHAA